MQSRPGAQPGARKEAIATAKDEVLLPAMASDGARGLISRRWNGDAPQPLSLTKRIGKGLPFANLAQASAL